MQKPLLYAYCARLAGVEYIRGVRDAFTASAAEQQKIIGGLDKSLKKYAGCGQPWHFLRRSGGDCPRHQGREGLLLLRAEDRKIN